MGEIFSKDDSKQTEIEGQKQMGSLEYESLSELAKKLFLNGKPLPLPRYHDVNWEDGQRFTEKDDPDRMNEAWNPPQFISGKDPFDQKSKLVVEEIDLESIGVDPYPNDKWPYHSFAKVVHHIFTPEECEELLKSVNQKGFTPALLNIGSGYQQLSKKNRDGHRCLVETPQLTRYLFEILRDHLPSNVCTENGEGGMDIVELNERCRFLLYIPGQKFPAHKDGCYVRPSGKRNKIDKKGGDLSRITIQLYLHDVPEDFGGATTFIGPEKVLPCQPKCGSALIFTQNLLHEGSLVKKGIKYTMRTEVMYRPKTKQ